MLRALYSGESGLLNHQTSMDTIGNNISNVNTTGFKSGRTNFAETFSQTLKGATAANDNVGGTNAMQIGLGTSLASIDTIFTNGSVQSTGKNTDMALSGSGLFVVNNEGQEYYTRNGDFEFDSEGNLVVAGTGYKVQGWMGSGGTVSASGSPTDIVVTRSEDPDVPDMPAQATAKAEYSLNLNASVPLITSMSNTSGSVTGTETATTANPLLLTLSDGSTQTVTSGTYTVGHSIPVETEITVYDAEGDILSVPVMFEKSGVNQWTVSAADQLEKDDGTTVSLSMTPVTLEFTETGASKDPATGTLSVGGQAVSLDFSALTQYAGSSTIMSVADGYTKGNLVSVSADNNGNLIGTYTNSQVQTLAQVAVATFPNASGLTKIGTSLYQKSSNSGEAKMASAEESGSTITAGALEMSNVDLATEFANMIVTQRGFQANSKIITVSDEILQTAINVKK